MIYTTHNNKFAVAPSVNFQTNNLAYCFILDFYAEFFQKPKK